MLISAVNGVAVNCLAVNGAIPLHRIASERVLYTRTSVPKCLFESLSLLSEVLDLGVIFGTGFTTLMRPTQAPQPTRVGHDSRREGQSIRQSWCSRERVAHLEEHSHRFRDSQRSTRSESLSSPALAQVDERLARLTGPDRYYTADGPSADAQKHRPAPATLAVIPSE